MPEALAEADAGWVTMHGPKIEHRRRQGELNAAMACGGGQEQLSEEEAERVLARAGLAGSREAATPQPAREAEPA